MNVCHNSNPFSPFTRKASRVFPNWKWKCLQSGGLRGGTDGCKQRRKTNTKQTWERRREEVMMERRVCARGPRRRGRERRARGGSLSQVFVRAWWGAMERHTDAPRMMEVTESYRAQSWPWPPFLSSVCRGACWCCFCLFCFFFTADVEGSLSKETIILSFMTSFCRFSYKNMYFQRCDLWRFLFDFPKAWRCHSGVVAFKSNGKKKKTRKTQKRVRLFWPESLSFAHK